MKKGIHPEYEPAEIVCSCGNRIQTRSTEGEIHVEICSVCHPFYTGRQKLVDTAGRVERFQRKYGDTSLSGVDEEAEDAADEEGDESGPADESKAPRKVTAGASEETAAEEAPAEEAAAEEGETEAEAEAEA